MQAYTLKTAVCQACGCGGMIRHMPCSRDDYDGVEETEEEVEETEEGDEEGAGQTTTRSADGVEAETETAGHAVHWCDDHDELPNGVQCISLHDTQDDEWWSCSGCRALHVRCTACQRRDGRLVRFCKLVAWCGAECGAGGITHYRLPTLELLRSSPPEHEASQ
jgi:hypothetical protein